MLYFRAKTLRRRIQDPGRTEKNPATRNPAKAHLHQMKVGSPDPRSAEKNLETRNPAKTHLHHTNLGNPKPQSAETNPETRNPAKAHLHQKNFGSPDPQSAETNPEIRNPAKNDILLPKKKTMVVKLESLNSNQAQLKEVVVKAVRVVAVLIRRKMSFEVGRNAKRKNRDAIKNRVVVDPIHRKMRFKVGRNAMIANQKNRVAVDPTRRKMKFKVSPAFMKVLNLNIIYNI